VGVIWGKALGSFVDNVLKILYEKFCLNENLRLKKSKKGSWLGEKFGQIIEVLCKDSLQHFFEMRFA